GNLLVHLLGGAVGFHQQNGGGAEVVAGLDEGLHRGGGGPVHHLEAGGNDARGDDGGHRIARLVHIGEGGHHHPGALGARGELDSHLGHHRQEPLGAHAPGEQIGARACRRLAGGGGGG